MARALIAHPATPGPEGIAVTGEAVRAGPGALALRYVVSGEVGRLWIPPPGSPGRADGLWRRTCFEAFVAAEGEDGYLEFNFSPSRQWAAYRFAGYREGLGAVPVAPRIEASADTARFELRADLDLDGLLRAASNWRIGLTAVIEEAGGRLSYWALAHSQGKPDFHRCEGFVLTLAA